MPQGRLRDAHNEADEANIDRQVSQSIPEHEAARVCVCAVESKTGKIGKSRRLIKLKIHSLNSCAAQATGTKKRVGMATSGGQKSVIAQRIIMGKWCKMCQYP